ncbi:GntR family transcriptional regulator [Rhizobacter sp. P5_C2]
MPATRPPAPPADSAAAPRYRWLAYELLQTIERGSFADNQALPSERELAETYEVSRDTVRKAVRYLEERGVLYSDHGRGTFVEPSIVRNMSRFLDSFSVDTAARGGLPGQKVLAIEPAAASMAVAGLLGLRPGEALLRIKRTRLINGQPVGLQDALLPASIGQGIDRAALEAAGSLYRLLQEKGIVPAEAIENLTAAAADSEDAELLGVPRGTPLLVCERVTLSERREPIEYCLMKYVPSYRYSTRINRHSNAL